MNKLKQRKNRMSDIAQRIKLSIAAKNVTYEELEQMTGISTSSLHRYATGKRSPKIEDIERIAIATGASPNYIAFGNADDIKKKSDEKYLENIQDEDERLIYKSVTENFNFLPKREKENIRDIVIALAAQEMQKRLNKYRRDNHKIYDMATESYICDTDYLEKKPADNK